MVEDGITFCGRHHLHDVGRVAAARALGVIGVDGAALEGGQRVLDEAALVERVGVDHHLHVHVVGHAQAIVDGAGRGAPILVQLERAGPGMDLLDQRAGQAGIALARKAEVHRQRVGGLQHPPDMERARRAGGGQRAMRGPGAAAEHRGDAGMQRVVHLLRADEMDMRVEPARGQDLALGRDRLGARADDDIDAGLRVGVARLADPGDQPVAQAHIGLVDAGVIDDQRVGDDRVHGPFGAGGLALPHAVADHLAAAELHLLAIGGAVPLHLDDQVGIGKPHAVAGGGAVHAGIGGAGMEWGIRVVTCACDGSNDPPSRGRCAAALRLD